MLYVFSIGVVIAFLTSIPVGPVGLICISRTITYGRLSGFIGALGAAMVDVGFAVIAAYGIDDVIRWIERYIPLLHGVGIVVLIVIAVRFLRKKVTMEHGRRSPVKDIESFFLSAFLALTNPVALFSFFALFAAAGIADDLRLPTHAFAAVVGVMVGACLWWYILCTAAQRFERHMNERTFTALNRGFGVLMIAFALYLISKLTFFFLP